MPGPGSPLARPGGQVSCWLPVRGQVCEGHMHTYKPKILLHRGPKTLSGLGPGELGSGHAPRLTDGAPLRNKQTR